MLAHADTAAPDFPHTGAAALYRGYKVTIHQRTHDGRAVVFGPGITARVDLDELSPATDAAAFDVWRATRIDPLASAFVVTDETDLWADFTTWIDTQGYDPALSGTRAAFTAALAAAGYRSQFIQIPTFVRGRRPTVMGWRVALLGGVEA